MNKDEIVRYVMNTPGNTNEQVLRMALDNLEGGGGGSTYPEIKVKFTTLSISSGEVPAHSILRITDNSGDTLFAVLVTRESFILPENGEVNCTTDLIFLSPQPILNDGFNVDADFTGDLLQIDKAISGAIEIELEPGVSIYYYLYDKSEISVKLDSK